MYKSQNQPSANLCADSIGNLVLKVCSERGTASVIGVTSRGIFLLAHNHRVIFISYQTYRSPLTVTLSGPPINLEQVQPGIEAHLSPESIEMPLNQVKISLSEGTPWTNPPPSGNARNHEEIHSNLVKTVDQILNSGNGLGFSPLLLPIIEPGRINQLDPESEKILENISHIPDAISRENLAKILAAFQGLIGSGRGLTPSGDDFIMGWLLTANRWPQLVPGRLLIILPQLNTMIVSQAYQATTSISANLIECAADGQADERLTDALDGIIDGNLPPRHCAENLLALGASSGIDALAGIASALCSIDDSNFMDR